jgi:DNA-binding protein H-NS
MTQRELERLCTDDLWSLHNNIATVLEEKLKEEKRRLTERLEQLQDTGRRPYPPVNPKYCNPEQPSEKWSGRGRTPRWLVEQLKTGHQIEEFRI